MTSARSRAFRTRRDARRGFTLVEVLVVLAILGVMAGVSVPAIRDRRAADPLEQGASEAITLLGRVRQTAVERGVTVRVSLDPGTRRYRVRTVASGIGADSVTADSLRLPDDVALDNAVPRLVAVFAPTGEARGDTLTMRWRGRTAAVSADQWTGDAHVATH